MKRLHPRRPAAWLCLTALLSASCAQNTANTSDCNSCPLTIGTLSPNAPINSTGSRSFRWSQMEQDWYLRTSLNDARSPSLDSQLHDFQGYVSTPVNTNASACVYVFAGINAEGGGEDKCEGLLSLKCRRWLTDAITIRLRSQEDNWSAVRLLLWMRLGKDVETQWPMGESTAHVRSSIAILQAHISFMQSVLSISRTAHALIPRRQDRQCYRTILLIGLWGLALPREARTVLPIISHFTMDTSGR